MNHEKVAILVDSGSDVPAELLERYHIFMIPLKILFHEAEYLDGLTIDAGEVYRRLPTEVPKTSLPDGGLITSVLDRIYQEGYRKVLAICISGHLSGTCFGCSATNTKGWNAVSSTQKTSPSAAASLPFAAPNCWRKGWILPPCVSRHSR